MLRTIVLSTLSLAVFCLGNSVRANDIMVGTFTFDELAFADNATQIDSGTISLFGSPKPIDLNDALTGFSPKKAIVNIGLAGNANHFQLDFIDLLAVNATGADIVFFDARFSADPYEIAVRPVGSSFTAFVSYAEADFIDTGTIGPGLAISLIFALPIELDDFGLASDTVVDAIQFRSLVNSEGTNNGDPVMAGVLNAAPDDTDSDGLTDSEEAAIGTDPNDPDTDDDGLLDGTEVEMADGTGCPDPLNPDSDSDTLLDGFEVDTTGTDPCNADTDGDGVPDNEDPTPLDPGVTSGFIEDSLRALSASVEGLDVALFDVGKPKAAPGLRNALSNKLNAAANGVAAGDNADAIDQLSSFLQKIDGLSPPADWMVNSPEKTALRADIELLIDLLSAL